LIDTTAVISDHIATWNEREPQQRRALVERMFTEDAVYTDPHRSGTGSAEIDAMIETAQEQSPGHHIDLTSGPEGHNDSVRFAWQLVGPDGPFGGAPTSAPSLPTDAWPMSPAFSDPGSSG